ncbi:MAG TPA: Holliday junction branch migration protein RuvA [Terrimesophilobacter sp.]|nr:Holliday junction branch migration protein RuvA [Terrimesophilobacter sp.]
MIASLSGTVLSISGASVVIGVGGIGLAVTVTATHARELRDGQNLTVSTALIVRDNELSLYGFRDPAHREVFELLIEVSGVGPKSAMSVLGELSIDEIAGAVAREDDSAFRKAQGIGPKTAKLIIVSLAGKLFAPASDIAGKAAANNEVAQRVVSALIGLGWNERLAASTVDDVTTSASDDDRASVQSLLRLALAELGTSRPSRSMKR